MIALRTLNNLGGSFGVGRSVFSSDTIIGLKGRFVFEAPGIAILMTAHRALEESVLTDKQNVVKSKIGQEWVDLVYKGFYFEPLRENLEAFLTEKKKLVTGEVIGTYGIAEDSHQATEANIQVNISADKLNGIKIAVPDAGMASHMIVVAKSSQGIELRLVDLQLRHIIQDGQVQALHMLQEF